MNCYLTNEIKSLPIPKCEGKIMCVNMMCFKGITDSEFVEVLLHRALEVVASVLHPKQCTGFWGKRVR